MVTLYGRADAPWEVSGRGGLAVGPAVRPVAADFPRDVCLTVWRNHAVFWRSWVRSPPGPRLFIGSFVGLYAFPCARASKLNQQICISPAQGRSSKLTHTGVEIDTCAFQTGCQLSSAAPACHWSCVFRRNFSGVKRACWTTGSWRSCLSLEVSGGREFDPRRVHDNVSVPLWVYMRFPVPEHHFDSNIACLCQSIEINNNKHVYRQSQVRMPNGCGVEWADCSLIIGIGCRVQFFAWSSIAQSVCQWAFSLLAIWCLRLWWVRILPSAEEDSLSPFDSKTACLCQSIEINNNKYVYRQSQVRMPNGSGVRWAECLLIIGMGCRVQVFSLILDRSVGWAAGIRSAGE